MVHVCFVSPKIHNFLDVGDPSSAGGAERQQYLLGKELLRRDHRVSLVTHNFDDGDPREMSEGFDVWKTLPDASGVRDAPMQATRLFETLRRVDADVNYVRGNDFFAMVAATAAELSESRFVYAIAMDSNVEPESLREKNALYRRGYLSSIRRADAVVAQTAYQRAVLEDAHDIESTRIPNGYSVPPASDVLSHAERDYVLWVGRMAREQKRPERFLDLARALPSVQFRMVGPPNDGEEAYFERLRSEAARIPNLQFEGFVPPEEVTESYRRASLLMNTSVDEGFPNTFLEAWRYATPVVSLEFDLDDKLRTDPVGVHSGSMERLVADVEALVEGIDRRAELGWNGRRCVEERYSVDTLVDDYEELFERIIGG